MWTRSHRSSTERRRLACFLGLLLAASAVRSGEAAAAPASAAAAPSAAGAGARKALSDLRFQRRMPERKGAEGLPPPTGRAPSVGRFPRIELPFLGLVAGLAQLVFFALVAAGLGLLALWLASEVWRRRSRSEKVGPGIERRLGGAGEEGPPSAEESSRLAAESRYGEAIHVLLLAALGQLAARARRSLPPHWTSREILRALPLGPETQGALREMVASVEGWLFGGQPVPAEEYERCRERYLRSTGSGAP